MALERFVFPLVIVLPLAGIACGGGSGSGGSSGGSAAPDGLVEADWNLVTLNVGQTMDIGVVARNSKHEPVSFTASVVGTCATVTTAADKIGVTAGSEYCQETIALTSATGVTRRLTVNVTDPMVMDIGDGLLIKFTTARACPGLPWCLFEQLPEGDGWFPLGGVMAAWSTDATTIPLVLVKDSGNSGALAAPAALTYRGTVHGQLPFPVTLFDAVCPEGYVALGGMQATWFPLVDNVRCVNRSYTATGTVGGLVTSLDAVGSYGNVPATGGNVYAIADPGVAPNDGRVPLNVGSSVACTGGPATCDASLVNVLLVPLPITYQSQHTDQPRLTSCAPLDTSKPRFFSSFVVPFTMLPSQNPVAHPELVAANVASSPFYTVERLETYKQVGNLIDNRQGSLPQSQAWTVETNWSDVTTNTFSKEVGIEITAGGDAKFLGTGGSWEVKVTGKLGWESSTATGYGGSESFQTTWNIAPGTCGELLQDTTAFRAISMSGIDVAPPIDGDSATLVFLQYPPTSGP